MAFNINVGGIFTRGKNKGAYRGDLNCPLCHKTKHKFLEKITPYRLRYQCKSCHATFQYDISNNLEHPYHPFKTAHFKRIVEASKYKKIGG